MKADHFHERRHLVQRDRRLEPAPRLLPLLLVSLLVSGCETFSSLPDPSPSERLMAIESAASAVLSSSHCDREGQFWTEESESGTQAITGRSLGISGIGRAFLDIARGIRRFETSGNPTTRTSAEYFDVASQTADWLIAQSVSSGGLTYWPQCLEVSPDATVEGCVHGARVESNTTCPIEQQEPAAGFQAGMAGVGDFFLQLYQDSGESYGTSAEGGADYLAAAEAVGDWLIATAATDSSDTGLPTAWWNDPINDPSPSALTCFADGNAGIAYFLVSLSRISCKSDYLGMAELAINLLKTSLIPLARQDSSQVQAYVIHGGGDMTAVAGFFHGNAGVAYSLLAWWKATGDAEARDSAVAILNYLAGTSGRIYEFGGTAWTDAIDGGAAPVHLEGGAAGIGWVYLEAAHLLSDAQSFSESDSQEVTADSYLATAEAAGSWLSNALVAHYFDGTAWWPTEISAATSETEQSGEANELTTESISLTGATLTYYPGIRRGVSGVGRFLAGLDSEDGVGCYAEVARNAMRWLYYRGEQESSDGERSWIWPRVIYRYDLIGELDSGSAVNFDFGIAGVAATLAVDRTFDYAKCSGSGCSLMGLPSLRTLSGSSAGCSE